MEYIVLDTNIYYKNWHLTGANFTYLSNYLENTGAILLSSKVVEEEVQNKYETEWSRAHTTLNNAVTQLSTFIPGTIQAPSVENYKYNFETVLKDKFNSITAIAYDHIENKTVVSRAIKRVAPFKENEKGFRDTLIWLSLLSFLRENDVESDVIFITENYTDYFDKESKQFKYDLNQDIKSHGIKCKIIPHISLNEFIGTLSKEEYESPAIADRLQELVYHSESSIETEIEFFINRLSTNEVQRLFSLKERYPFIESLIDFTFEIHEGLEDINLVQHRKVAAREYYVTYNVELRICVLLFGIPFDDYKRNKEILDSRFSNIYFAEDTLAYFEKIVRPKLAINFILDLESETVRDLEVTNGTFVAKGGWK